VGKAVTAGDGRQAGSPRRPRAVGIAGAGSIGVAWSLVFARAGFDVRLYDPAAARRAAVPGELACRLAALTSEALLTEEDDVVAGRVRLTGDLADAVTGVSYVQECAPEALAVKRELFAQLDDLSAADIVLASSSSALTASAITAGLPGAHRCLIAHPGNPPYLLPVVELVPGRQTTPQAMDAAENLMRRAGMTPIRLHTEIEGFVFNRLQGAVLREAYCLVRDGVVAPEDIDLVMRLGLGRRWSVLGPFETSELNTRGGVDAHAAIMGPAYARMGAQRGQSDAWEPELVSRVAAGAQRRFPRSRWDDNVAWRDRALMVLERCWRERPVLSGPPAASDGRKR
jgi:L-gulonate 3-dehydrogenase